MMIILLALLESALIVYALRSEGPYRLRGLVVINLILVSLFASKLLVIAGLETNIASVLYASVVVIQTLVYYYHGKSGAMQTIRMATFSLASALALVFVINTFPSIQGNELYANAIATLANTTFWTPVASFLAFIVGQLVLLESLGHKLSPITSIVLCQLVDSLIFYPIAFIYLPIHEIITIMSVGFLFKVFVTPLIVLPILPFISIFKLTKYEEK